MLLVSIWSVGGYSQNSETINISQYVPTTGNKAVDASSPLTQGDIKIYIEKKSSNNPGLYASDKTIRLYSKDILHIENEAKAISKIEFTGTAALTGISNKVWSGTPSNKISLTGSGTNKITKIVLTYESTSTPTTISFNSAFDATKTYTFTNGAAPADYQQPTVTLSPAEATAGGSVIYKSSNTDVVAVDETTGALSFDGKTVFDTEATITAQFVASAGSAYANSNELSYKVKNVEAQEAKPILAFSASRIEVKQGEEASFKAPTLTLTDKDGNNVALGKDEILYESSNEKTVAEVNVETGEVIKWVAPGETVVTASYLGKENDYEGLTASYTLAYIEKEKIATTLAFKDGEHTLNINESMTVKAVLKANDAEVAGDVKYTSSDEDVAMVDETTGEVLGITEGSATIKATFEGNADYLASEATYEITVADPNKKEVEATAFYESFDKITDKGGNDGLWSGTDPSQANWDTSTADNSGWTKSTSYVYTANKCIRLGSSSKQGSATTPALGISGDATLTFKAASWGTDNATLSLSLSGGGTLDETTIKPTNSEFTTYTVHITDAETTTKIKFATVTKRVFLDEIRITQPKRVSAVTLDESETADETENKLLENADKLVYMTIRRTISADYLNPVCLPFDLTQEQIADVFGEGSVVSEYTSATGSVMNFTTTTTMTANKPYIVKATQSFTTKDIKGVTLKLAGKDDNRVEYADGNDFLGAFVGSVGKFSFTSADGDQLFLGKDGDLYKPESVGQQLRGMRAYFEVIDETGNGAKVNIGGGVSSISKLMSGEAMTGKVYNLNGQLVGTSLDTLPKGVYVIDGKKYVTK